MPLTSPQIRETRDVDTPLAIRHFYHHAGWAQLLDKELPDWQPVGSWGGMQAGRDLQLIN